MFLKFFTLIENLFLVWEFVTLCNQMYKPHFYVWYFGWETEQVIIGVPSCQKPHVLHHVSTLIFFVCSPAATTVNKVSFVSFFFSFFPGRGQGGT